MHLPYERSNSFFDVDVNRQFVLRTLVVIIHFGLNLDLSKPVRLVKSLQSRDVIFEQLLTVASVAQQTAGGLNLQVRS